MAFLFLPPFDPSRTFIARQTKRIAGRAYAKGDLIDKASIPPRVLRMLYDHHQIGYEGEDVRRDIDSVHPRRINRAGEALLGDAAAGAGRKSLSLGKGPAQRPITNPSRRERARAAARAGAAAQGAAASAVAAAPAQAPAASAPPAEPVQRRSDGGPLDHDHQGGKGGSLAGQDATAAIGAERRREASESDPRLGELVAKHDRPGLIALAEKLPGFKASMSKTRLAQLIVDAGNGAA